MPSVQALLRRVQRLEAARTATLSPVVPLYGSIDAFAEGTDGLDRHDFPVVLDCLRRWERDGVWDVWERNRYRVWEMGA
jgi:hypothetical protein